MAEKIQYFQTVKTVELPEYDPSNLNGKQIANNLGEMQIGAGGQVFRADQQGIWLGAENFINAPFSVDMQGNLVATSASFTGYATLADLDPYAFDSDLNAYVPRASNSTLSAALTVGNANVKIDGANARITVSDGSNNRCLFGQF